MVDIFPLLRILFIFTIVDIMSFIPEMGRPGMSDSGTPLRLYAYLRWLHEGGGGMLDGATALASNNIKNIVSNNLKLTNWH